MVPWNSNLYCKYTQTPRCFRDWSFWLAAFQSPLLFGCLWRVGGGLWCGCLLPLNLPVHHFTGLQSPWKWAAGTCPCRWIALQDYRSIDRPTQSRRWSACLEKLAHSFRSGGSPSVKRNLQTKNKHKTLTLRNPLFLESLRARFTLR